LSSQFSPPLWPGAGSVRPQNEEKINKTASTYLRALADGDTTKVCAQFTSRAKGERCEPAMKERLSQLDADALKTPADGSIDVGIAGDNGDGATLRARMRSLPARQGRRRMANRLGVHAGLAGLAEIRHAGTKRVREHGHGRAHPSTVRV
jgi:hypothetical protein